MDVLLVLVFLPDLTPNSIFPRTIFRLQVPHSTSHTTLHTKTQIPRPSPSLVVVLVIDTIQSRKGTTAIIIHSNTRSKKGERVQYYTNAKISFETTRLLLLLRQQNTRKFTTFLNLSQSSVELVPTKFFPPQQKKLFLTPIQSTATEECRAATTGKTTTERHNLVKKCGQKKHTHTKPETVPCSTSLCSLVAPQFFPRASQERARALRQEEEEEEEEEEEGRHGDGGAWQLCVRYCCCCCLGVHKWLSIANDIFTNNITDIKL
jgi:hypothetical protein